ncbi:hypothetical protein RFI_05002 [Reticulomyxa filosa]|uniref:Uncharacterized protein n=1 Tax=Reticulomyxa filosa TaxID=46433 RepID=X6P0M6_RETFI|nr:hypothetical protein RFI_05002 [Reticulomyxa filosa]|eukprot:ETO32115.1 hypothetical protein RFI_05002 [Reticulomyxa filosa]
MKRFEIAHCTYIAFTLFVLSSERMKFGYDWESEGLAEVINFVQGRDARIRLACVNHALKTQGMEKEIDTFYANVTFKSLRKARNANIWEGSFKSFYLEIWREIERDDLSRLSWNQNMEAIAEALFRVVVGFVLAFIIGPIYLLSRFLNVLFPAIFIIYIYWYNLWAHVGLLQIVMTCIYVLLLVILGLLFIKVFYIHFLMWLCSLFFVFLFYCCYWARSISKRYYLVKTINLREQIVIETLGLDIGNIVVSYLPKWEELHMVEETDPIPMTSSPL